MRFLVGVFLQRGPHHASFSHHCKRCSVCDSKGRPRLCSLSLVPHWYEHTCESHEDSNQNCKALLIPHRHVPSAWCSSKRSTVRQYRTMLFDRFPDCSAARCSLCVDERPANSFFIPITSLRSVWISLCTMTKSFARPATAPTLSPAPACEHASPRNTNAHEQRWRFSAEAMSAPQYFFVLLRVPLQALLLASAASVPAPLP